VLAAGVDDGENHQIGVGEQPIFDASAGGSRHARELAEVAIAREAAQVLAADAGQAGDFVLSEDFLARPNSDHVHLSARAALHST